MTETELKNELIRRISSLSNDNKQKLSNIILSLEISQIAQEPQELPNGQKAAEP
jgi:hypothetical protein